MKKIIALLTVLILFSGCEVLQQVSQSAGLGIPVTQDEAGQGIKEALSQGLVRVVLQLNKPDGFFKDLTYKVLLPPDAQKIEDALRAIGLDNLVDKAILQINRGAEDAAGYAKPIFVNAIKNMTLTDAIGLVKNGDTSATHFFREKTTQQLYAAFLPIIKSSLNRVDATKYYGDIVNKYNNFPLTFKKINPDLASYVTTKATNALFDQIAMEEKDIRTNFASRTSAILKRVFGAK